MSNEKELTPYNGDIDDFVRRVERAMAQEGMKLSSDTLENIKKIALGEASADDILEEKKKVR